jgi:hypothetical protein
MVLFLRSPVRNVAAPRGRRIPCLSSSRTLLLAYRSDQLPCFESMIFFESTFTFEPMPVSVSMPSFGQMPTFE